MCDGVRGLLGQVQQNSHCRAQDGEKYCKENPNEPMKRLLHVIFNPYDMCFDLGKGECVLFGNRFKPCQSFVSGGL